VQPAKPGDPLGARPQHQVIGVAQDDVGARALHLVDCQALDRPGRADRHEGRRANVAARGLQDAGTGRTVGGADQEREGGHQGARHSRLASP
jgi:hypothetical protein